MPSKPVRNTNDHFTCSATAIHIRQTYLIQLNLLGYSNLAPLICCHSPLTVLVVGSNQVWVVDQGVLWAVWVVLLAVGEL